MQPHPNDPTQQEVLDLLSGMTDAEIQAVRDLLGKRRQQQYPRPISREDLEKIAAVKGFGAKWVDHRLAHHQALEKAREAAARSPFITLTNGDGAEEYVNATRIGRVFARTTSGGAFVDFLDGGECIAYRQTPDEILALIAAT